jgi:hypothetical protein
VAFLLNSFAARRPFLYHLTHNKNAEWIKRTSQLETAGALLNKAQRLDIVGRRRDASFEVTVAGSPVVITDQARLFQRNTSLEDGWSFERLVEYLNQHVFFWPGTATKPVDSALRYFARYAAEKPVIVKVPTASLFAENSSVEPLFSKFNSGAPRCVNGRRSPRGRNTFQISSTCNCLAGDVVEVVFRGPVRLPRDTEFKTNF